MQLAYRVAGTGDTVLLLHGSAASHLLWRRLSRSLESRYRVVAPDLLGYGESSGWPGASPFRLEDEMEPLWRLMPEGDDGLHVVGYSYGAVVALGLALAKRRRLSSLALIEPVAFRILGETGQSEVLEDASRWRCRVETLVREGDTAGAMRLFVDYWSGGAAWDVLADDARGRWLAAAPKILLDLRVSFETPFDAAALAELALPTLLVSGGRSPLPTRRVTRALARLIGRSEFAVIETAGHDLPMTHGEALDDRIIRHIAMSSSGRGRRP